MTHWTEEQLQQWLAQGRRRQEAIWKVTEAQFQDQVRQVALWLQWAFYHTHDSRKSDEDFPDCIMVRPPRLIVAELKVDGKDATPGQQWWLDLFARAGAETYVWHPSEIGKIMEILK